MWSLTLRCVVWLCRVQLYSAVWCTLRSLTQQCDVHSRVLLRTVPNISRLFEIQYRRECNWYIFKEKFKIGVLIYALKLQIRDLGTFCDPPHASPLHAARLSRIILQYTDPDPQHWLYQWKNDNRTIPPSLRSLHTSRNVSWFTFLNIKIMHCMRLNLGRKNRRRGH